MSRVVDAIALFFIVASLLLLPISSLAFAGEPMLSGINDFKDLNNAREEDKPYHSATDISTFTNTKYIFFLPPALMGVWGYSWDKYWTRSYFGYTYGYPSQQPRLNQNFLQIFSYEKDTSVRIELVNGEATNAVYNPQSCTWTCDKNTKVSKFDGQNTLEQDRVKTLDMSPYQSIRIPTITWTNEQLAKGIFYISRELNDRFTAVVT